MGNKTIEGKIFPFVEKDQPPENKVKLAILKLVPYSRMKKQMVGGRTKRMKNCTVNKCRCTAKFHFEKKVEPSMRSQA